MDKLIRDAYYRMGQSAIMLALWPLVLVVGLLMVLPMYLIYWYLKLGAWIVIKFDNVFTKT